MRSRLRRSAGQAAAILGVDRERAGDDPHRPGQELSRNVWLYQRRDLPVRVVKKYATWRLIQDPDGAQGWMLVTLLSDRRTAMVKPGEPRPVRVDPNDGAKVRYKAEHGVVGRISKCRDGWCRIEIGNRDGYIHTDIWGVARTRWWIDHRSEGQASRSAEGAAFTHWTPTIPGNERGAQ